MVSEQKYSQDVVLKVSVHFFAKMVAHLFGHKRSHIIILFPQFFSEHSILQSPLSEQKISPFLML